MTLAPSLVGRVSRRAVLLLGTFVLMTWAGVTAVASAPDDGHVIGIWPVGLATGALILARRSWLPAVGTAIALVAFGSILVSDKPVGVSAGYAAALTLVACIGAAVLRRKDGAQPQLRTDADLRTYFTACLGSSIAGAAVAATTSATAGYGDPGIVALAIGMATLASQLIVVPLYLRLPTQRAIARTGERVLQWVTIAGLTPLVFVPTASPSLVFLAIPVLAWGALRITPVEALAQMVAVLGVAITLTTVGRGPFADAPRRYGLDVDVRGVLLAAFAASVAVIVVPLVLRVGEYVGAARAASAERDLVRGIVDGASAVAIIATDEIGRITLFNPGAEQLLGYEAAEVLGCFTTLLHTPGAVTDKAAELGTPDDFVAVVLALVDGQHVATPMRFRRKDGVERVHSMTITQVVDHLGRVTGYVSTSEDVTDELVAQQALRDALEAERQAVDRLRGIDAVKDQFVSTVSHELRTPITSILGYLEMLSDGAFGPLEASQADALTRVQSNSHRLLGLIDELLTLSRVTEEGLQASGAEVFDLGEAVSTGYAVVAPAWETKSLDVSLVTPETPVPTYGDRVMVERAVVNLIGNAVKFTDDGGTVSVELAVEGEESVLLVSDTGIGVPLEEQAHLFTRFFRSSLAEGKAIPGSGLGLSITHAIVEQHGGTISATSVPGTGTTIEVRLPVRPGMYNIQLPLGQDN